MENIKKILKQLAEEGYRKSEIRKKLLKTLQEAKAPLFADQIKSHLNQKYNKTTIYREIKFLQSKNIIKEIQFLGERRKRYELSNLPHHHHLICKSCKKTEDVFLSEALEKEEIKLSKNKNFKILYHTLEFFGLCAKCNN